jgi:imidazolonepropionase-like amidohydrolase
VAKFLGEEGKSGVVRQGARGDLILLDANPLQDVANTLRINGVMVNGRWIGPAEREKLLQALVSP